MKISIKDFGEFLMSRPNGREAFLQAKAYIFCDLNSTEKLVLDFADVKVLAPSWADEFITSFKNNYPNEVEYLNTENASVKQTLKFLG